MKIEAQILPNALQRRLARLVAELEPAALDAMNAALARELENARRGEGNLKTPMRAAVTQAVARALSRRR